MSGMGSQAERAPVTKPGLGGGGADDLDTEPLTATDMRPNCKIWLTGPAENGALLEISGPVGVTTGESVILFWRNEGKEAKAPFMRWVIPAAAEIEIEKGAKLILAIESNAEDSAAIAPFQGGEHGPVLMGKGMTAEVEEKINALAIKWRDAARKSKP